jgi:hypothetical protein
MDAYCDCKVVVQLTHFANFSETVTPLLNVAANTDGADHFNEYRWTKQEHDLETSIIDKFCISYSSLILLIACTGASNCMQRRGRSTDDDFLLGCCAVSFFTEQEQHSAFGKIPKTEVCFVLCYNSYVMTETINFSVSYFQNEDANIPLWKNENLVLGYNSFWAKKDVFKPYKVPALTADSIQNYEKGSQLYIYSLFLYIITLCPPPPKNKNVCVRVNI